MNKKLLLFLLIVSTISTLSFAADSQSKIDDELTTEERADFERVRSMLKSRNYFKEEGIDGIATATRKELKGMTAVSELKDLSARDKEKTANKVQREKQQECAKQAEELGAAQKELRSAVRRGNRFSMACSFLVGWAVGREIVAMYGDRLFPKLRALLHLRSKQ